MKKSKIIKLLIVLTLFATFAFGANDYSAGLDGLDVVGTKGTTTISAFGNMVLTFAGWALLLGLPFGAYKSAYAHFKKQDERNENDSSSAMTQAKSAFIALIGAFVASMLFIMIAKNVLHLDEAYGSVGNPASSGTIIMKVLKISN